MMKHTLVEHMRDNKVIDHPVIDYQVIYQTSSLYHIMFENMIIKTRNFQDRKLGTFIVFEHLLVSGPSLAVIKL